MPSRRVNSGSIVAKGAISTACICHLICVLHTHTHPSLLLQGGIDTCYETLPPQGCHNDVLKSAGEASVFSSHLSHTICGPSAKACKQRFPMVTIRVLSRNQKSSSPFQPQITSILSPLPQKTFLGRVRVSFAQNEGHEKATKKPRKRPKRGPNTVFLDRRGPRKSYGKATLDDSLTGSDPHPARLDLVSSRARPELDTSSLSELSTPGVAAA